MAMVLLGAGLGEEDEKSEGAAPESQAGAQAFVAAFGAIASRQNPRVARETKFSTAIQRGPHSRDALKSLGNALAKQGRGKEALTKYDTALKYAPTWTPLIEARSAVANQKQ
jgi:Tfp pilus assembly protein PilF